MKKLALLLIVFVLCGCQVNMTQIKNDITKEIESMSDHEPISYTSMEKPLYSYYLPKDIGRISSNEISSLFIKDGVKFIMNFNPNKIVVHDYYRKNIVLSSLKPIVNHETDKFYESNGNYLGSDHRYHEFKCEIIELEDNNYLLKLDMAYVNFIAVLKPVQLEVMIHSMFVIAKSIQYDADEVVQKYSLRSTSESVKVDLDEFNDELPDSGSITNLIEKKSK